MGNPAVSAIRIASFVLFCLQFPQAVASHGMEGITIAELSSGAAGLIQRGELGGSPSRASNLVLVSLVTASGGYASLNTVNNGNPQGRPVCMTWLEGDGQKEGFATFGMPGGFSQDHMLCRSFHVRKLSNGQLEIVGASTAQSSYGQIKQTLPLLPITWPEKAVGELNVLSLQLGPIDPDERFSSDGVDVFESGFCGQCDSTLLRYQKSIGTRPGSGNPNYAQLVLGSSVLGGYSGNAVHQIRAFHSYHKSMQPKPEFDSALETRYGRMSIDSRSNRPGAFYRIAVYAYDAAGRKLSEAAIVETCNPLNLRVDYFQYRPHSDVNLWGCGPILNLHIKETRKAGVEYVTGYEAEASFPAAIAHHHFLNRLQQVQEMRSAYIALTDRDSPF